MHSTRELADAQSLTRQLLAHYGVGCRPIAGVAAMDVNVDMKHRRTLEAAGCLAFCGLDHVTTNHVNDAINRSKVDPELDDSPWLG